MTTKQKRRIDNRRIRITATFSAKELAEATGMHVSTVNGWFREGMPTIDDKSPKMVYGWEAKEFLRKKWSDRQSTCGEFELYCFKCQAPNPPEIGTLIIERRGNCHVAIGRCSHCGTIAYRAVVAGEVAEWLHRFAGQSGEEGRFNRQGISPTSQHPASQAAESGSDGVLVAGKQLNSEVSEFLNLLEDEASAQADGRVPILPQNPSNERLKKEYFAYLRHAAAVSELTIRKHEGALLHYENFTRFADFGRFGRKLAIDYKEFLSAGALAKPTILAMLKALQRMLHWLAQQDGFKSRIHLTDIDFLNLSRQERRSANAPREMPFPKLEMILEAVRTMPTGTPLEKRDQALVAFLAISAIRESAVATLRLKHFDLERGLVNQDPREVHTKCRKHIVTFLMLFGDGFVDIVHEWVRYLRDELGFLPDDPLFPKSVKIVIDGKVTGESEIVREPWSDAQRMADIFKAAFAKVGLPAFTPHSFRKMIIAETYKRNPTIVEFKAISQNLGHSTVNITLQSYGKIPAAEQGRLIQGLAKSEVSEEERQAQINQAIELLNQLKRKT